MQISEIVMQIATIYAKCLFKVQLIYYNYRYFNDNFIDQIFDFLLFILDCMCMKNF